ncbi:P-loop containing nucleoside triphosphate hydrolase protein [Fistulina hepatica ATCC 64428]|uniref:p-loop containing nucleoside triphosphate hydrolase protein n=1 Tax=Fistulina hepatica ATCC 64428 TaxID=1128425 RepID=A0A0D7AFV5_9AGAR|nr:P-loop containing nucleoside triphosphate hydrolase protein [Fistulina hepatica ATCC 64428]
MLHENPLGLPRSRLPASVPRMPSGRLPPKRAVPNVKKVVAVASGKGGVGKSTVAVNLAMSLAATQKLRVGILDLDVFGPSVPTLMGLQDAPKPNVTPGGAILPLTNHGIPTMSMGYLLPKSTNDDTAVVWRGLMVQKAVQQLLFDVDWGTPALDVLIVDLPPGTGDVPLTLGQLVTVDGSVIVSTPQDVALADVRKGISMMRKLSIPASPFSGLVLNEAYFLCPECLHEHYLFGPPQRFQETARALEVDILAELPLVSNVSESGDTGVPLTLRVPDSGASPGASEWKRGLDLVAQQLYALLHIKTS